MSTATTSGIGKAPSTGVAHSDEIAAELAALRADVAALAKSIGGYGKARTSELRSSAKATSETLLDSSREAVQDIRKQIDELEGQLETRVREHPLQTLMIALGLGFLISLVIRR